MKQRQPILETLVMLVADYTARDGGRLDGEQVFVSCQLDSFDST